MPVINAMTGRRGLPYLANENDSQDQMKKALCGILFFRRADDDRSSQGRKRSKAVKISCCAAKSCAGCRSCCTYLFAAWPKGSGDNMIWANIDMLAWPRDKIICLSGETGFCVHFTSIGFEDASAVLTWLIEDILRDFLIARFRRMKSKKSEQPSAQNILRAKRRNAKRARARSRSKL